VTAMQRALPRHHYVQEDSWRAEREQVLLREWTCVGRLDELGLSVPGSGVLSPGRRVVVDLLGESIVVTVDDTGTVRALANVCRHRGSQLVPVDPLGERPPACDAKSLRCPYHSWTYDLAGRLLHAPHTEDLDPDQFSLQRLSAEVWGGWLWLSGSADASPLAEGLGPVPDRVRRYPLATLVLGERLTYRVRANWKVIAENYNECYHCGPVHPELSRLVPAFGGGGAELDWEGGIPHREGAWTFTMTGDSRRAPFPDLDDDERTRHKGELIYPNLLLSLAAEHVAGFRLRPLAVDLTEVVCELLFAADESRSSDFDPSDAAALWDLVNRQDWAICESVQRGMSSRYYADGWFAPMEDGSLDIRRWLLPRLASVQDAAPGDGPVG
jgi:phenylpropionate dioxygenase-like ring-hydroxylating dioxygenase large terminal subunit